MNMFRVILEESTFIAICKHVLHIFVMLVIIVDMVLVTAVITRWNAPVVPPVFQTRKLFMANCFITNI